MWCNTGPALVKSRALSISWFPFTCRVPFTCLPRCPGLEISQILRCFLAGPRTVTASSAPSRATAYTTRPIHNLPYLHLALSSRALNFLIRGWCSDFLCSGSGALCFLIRRFGVWGSQFLSSGVEGSQFLSAGSGDLNFLVVGLGLSTVVFLSKRDCGISS